MLDVDASDVGNIQQPLIQKEERRLHDHRSRSRALRQCLSRLGQRYVEVVASLAAATREQLRGFETEAVHAAEEAPLVLERLQCGLRVQRPSVVLRVPDGVDVDLRLRSVQRIDEGLKVLAFDVTSVQAQRWSMKLLHVGSGR